MKRKYWSVKTEVVINTGFMKCGNCLHVRLNEPYFVKHYYHVKGENHNECTCWRCCRDAESTFLIKQKWPIAFERFCTDQGCILDWSPGVRELVGENEKA